MVAERDYTLTIYRRSDGASVSFTNTDNNNRLVSAPEYEWQENHPKKLTARFDNMAGTEANNLLSSSYSGWSSGTGAVELGDYIRYSIVPTGDTTERTIFDGVIVQMNMGGDGILTLEARCFLQRAENQKRNNVVFKNYRDTWFQSVTDGNDLKSIDNITDSDIQTPCVRIGYAAVETITELDDNVAGTDQVIRDPGGVNPKCAQGFITDDNALLACTTRFFSSALETWEITCEIQGAHPDGGPDGVVLATDIKTSTFNGSSDITFYFINASLEPVYLQPKKKYYFVFSTDSTSSNSLYVDINGQGSNNPVSGYAYYTDNWYKAPGTVNMEMVTANYEEVPPEAYTVSEDDDKIYFQPSTPDNSAAGYTLNYKKGLVMYYYGTLTLEEVMDALITQNLDINADSPTALDVIMKTYSPSGRSVAACLRELSDTTEPTGSTWAGYQHVVASYVSGGTPYSGDRYITMKKRHKIGDTSSRTFAHGDDTSVDDDHRIIGMALKKSGKNIPASVTIIGEAGGDEASKRPVIMTIHDGGETDGLRDISPDLGIDKQAKLPYIRTEDDAFRVASAYMDAYERDVWSGTITVSGVYPDLMEIDTASDYYGSGKIITLKYTRAGITNGDYKVTGVHCDGTSTTVYLTNTDALLDNRIRQDISMMDVTQGLYAPTGLTDTLYINVFDDVVDSSSASRVFVSLQDSTGGEINNYLRAECLQSADDDPYWYDSARNLRVYQAVIESHNGYTDDGTPVAKIKLYDAQSGGSVILDYDLYSAGPPVRDERFYKWRTLRVIVNYTCKAS